MPNNYSSKDRKKTPAASYGQRERKGSAPAWGRKTGESPRERNSFRPAAARKAEDGPRRTGRPFQDGKTERDNRKNGGYRDYEYREEARPRREWVPSFESRPEQDTDTEKYILTGRNPIREALKNHRDLEKLMVQKGDLSGSALEIIQKAKEQKIMIQTVDKSRLDEIAPRHQGLIAFASAYQYCTVEDILETAREKGEAPFIIILDGVTDPHNLGAIIRTAECVGAHGVIVPQHRSVGLTPAAVKASAVSFPTVHLGRDRRSIYGSSHSSCHDLPSTLCSSLGTLEWPFSTSSISITWEPARQADFSGVCSRPAKLHTLDWSPAISFDKPSRGILRQGQV